MCSNTILRNAECDIVGVLSKLVSLLPLPLLGLRFSPNHKTSAPSRTEARKVCRLTLTAFDACWVARWSCLQVVRYCTQSGEPTGLFAFHNHLHQNSAASTLSLQACGSVATYVFHNAYLLRQSSLLLYQPYQAPPNSIEKKSILNL